MAQTANQALYDAALRHHVHLLRFAEGQAEAAAQALKAAEDDLLSKITAAMAKGNEVGRLEAMLASVKKRRAEVYEQLGKDTAEALQGLAEAEADWEVGALQGASPIRLNLAAVPLEALHATVAAPIAGIPLQGWLDGIRDKEAQALQQAVTMAVLQGETIDDLVRRIRGTKANAFKDGILSTSTRNAQALARTAVNHVSNAARDQVWQANSDIVRALRWTSTLDGRTSTICQSRDGHMAPIGDGGGLLPGEQPLAPALARPPAHFNCRSLMVPVLDGDEIAGDRPFVADERTRAKREAAFRAEAKDRGVHISVVRKEWADKHVGRVPAATTYQEWLRKQPHGFQDEVLGVGKAELFRSGVPLERFVDKSGKVLSLAELKAEIAGDALNVLQPAIGLKAKGLLMQGLEPDEVLAAIKNEFPEAKTTAASIASYKSELKKAGLLDPSAKPTFQQMYMSTATQTELVAFEGALPAGLKNAMQGQWATAVDSLEGHPGAYAHYKPGVGVELANDKLGGLSKAQVRQVMAHELGHYLHKVHGLGDELLKQDGMELAQTAIGMPPELKKLYGYYVHSQDELWAEIVGQAIHPSPVTSQGMAAEPFRTLFADYIHTAQDLVKAKFPDAPPVPQSGPVMSGIGEVAGKPTSIGGFAKALLQQGMPDEDVLKAIHAEFPGAKTTMNSIKSYKSELKKAEQKAIGTPGPTVEAKMAPKVDPEAPQVAPAPKGAVDPAAEPPKPQTGSVPLSGLTKIGGKPGGTNPGAVYKDIKGDEWLVKGNIQKANGTVASDVSDARARNEVLASRLLRLADEGIAPEMKLVDLEGQYGGGQGVMSRMLDKPMVKFDPKNEAHLQAARRDFALHAWLGNWDVVGADYDNLVMKAGKAVNIDPGGALLFRAQGLPKKLSEFDGVVDEWNSMRTGTKNPKAKSVYGGMTDAELHASAQQLLKFTDEVIDAQVEAMGPGGVPFPNSVLKTVLKARRDDILKRVNLEMPKPGAVAQAASGGVPTGPLLPADMLADLSKVNVTAQKNLLEKFDQEGLTLSDLSLEWKKVTGYEPSVNELIDLAASDKFVDYEPHQVGIATIPQPVAKAVQATNYKAMTPSQLADAVVPSDLEIKSWYGKTKASWIIQKAAAELFKTGVKTDVVHEALVAKFGPTFVPKAPSLASMKSKLKKMGLLEGEAGAAAAESAGLKQPALWGKPMGSKSTSVKEQAKLMVGTKSAPEIIEWIGSQFTTPNAKGAQDLYELAYYEKVTGKVHKPAVKATYGGYTPQPTLPAPVPLRPAAHVREAGPPPPRFTAEGRQAGLQKYGGHGQLGDTALLSKINKRQKAAGLEDLEPEEVAAIKAYTGSAFRQVNTLLRGGHFASDTYLQAWTDAAMHGLHKMPPFTGTVKRGMSISAAEVKQLKMFYRPGAVVEEKQFTSTANAETGGSFGGNVRYTIKSKTGRDVKPISSFKGENEILFMPGTKFRVVKVEETSGGYQGTGLKIELEEV